jgi:membrane protease YdiL (CAAX protease family)
LISFFLPAAYVGLVYGAIWALGLGRLEDAPVVDQAVMVLTWMAGGATIGAFLAFGEEVGWQGFLVPEVSAITTFARTSLTRGLIWSVWHYPLIVGGVYGPTETPLWYRLVCFTTTMTAVSFAFTWLRIRSGSLWTGVWLHASHNVFFQEIYPNLTTESDSTMWYVDEFGAFSALAAVLVAIVFWSRRADLASDGEGAQSTEIEQARAIADTGTRLETTVPRR